MPLGKRRPMSYNTRAKRARLTGRMTRGATNVAMRPALTRLLRPKLVSKVNTLYRMIETKESCRSSPVNTGIVHNNLIVVGDQAAGGALNFFRMQQAAGDPMQAGDGHRIGDQISVRGVLIKGFVENALGRPKVYYRVMVLRGAKGETFTRDTIFKNSCGNKMLDQVNTERFSILAQQTFNVSASNVAASGVELANGAPLIATAGGVGTRTFKMWLPGRKFGRNGNVQYENSNNTQVKFYDYRVVIVCYDWYGTPQDANVVGRLNECFSKIYYKDA